MITITTLGIILLIILWLISLILVIVLSLKAANRLRTAQHDILVEVSGNLDAGRCQMKVATKDTISKSDQRILLFQALMNGVLEHGQIVRLLLHGSFTALMEDPETQKLYHLVTDKDLRPVAKGNKKEVAERWNNTETSTPLYRRILNKVLP